MPTLRELFEQNPQAAVDARFESERQRLGIAFRDSIFVWTTVKDKDDVRYGRYRDVSRKELQSRQHVIEFFDGNVSFLFTDVIYAK